LDWINILVSIVNAFASCCIAYYAYSNFKIINKLEEETKQRHTDQIDLYKAIVISTLLSSGGGTGFDTRKTEFKKHYDGEKKIFQEKTEQNI